METVDCAMCGSGDREILATKARFNLPATTVICKKCGMVFLNPRMTMKEYEEFYSSPAYRKLYSSTEKPTRQLDERSLRGAWEKFHFFSGSIGLNLFKTKKFLDVGCSAGYLPFVFSKNGWDAEGLEPTRTFAEHGRRKFGLKIRAGLLENEAFVSKYSFITLIHVFEHITDPHAALRKLKKLLTDGGILYIEVPNVQEFYGRFEQSCDIAHPYFYSPATLSGVMKMNGFEIVKLISGSSVRVFAKKGPSVRVKISEYEKTLRILQKCRRNHYLKGYFIFTPLFENFSRFVANHAALAKAIKKFARAYSKSRLPFSNALKQLGAVE